MSIKVTNTPSEPHPDSSPSVDGQGVATGTPTATPERPRYGRVAKRGVLWSFTREAVSEILTTPTAMIMARLLTPFDFGIGASASFFLTLATRLTNFGFNQALVRVKHLRKEHCSSVFVISLAVGALAYAVILGTAGWMARFFGAPQLAQVMPIAALTFLISPFGTVPAALLTRDMRFGHTAVCDWLGGIALAVSSIAFALAGHGFWSLVYSRVVGDVVNTIAKLALGRWRPSFVFSPTAAGELLSFGTGVFAKRLLDYAANNLDNMVVARLMGIATLGFYDKAFVTMNRVLQRINTGGPIVSFRIFSLIYEEHERFRRAYSKVILASSLVSYPILISLAAAASDLLEVMYGKRWLVAAVPFQILCVAGVFKVLNEYAGSAAQAWGKIWGQVWRQAVYASLIVVFVAMFSRWGLPGAAFGVLLATLTMTVLMNLLLMRLAEMSVWEVVQPQIPGCLAALAMAAAILGVRQAMVAAGAFAAWQLLLAEAAAAGAAYLAFIKFNRFREVRALVRGALEDLSPSLRPVGRFLN